MTEFEKKVYPVRKFKKRQNGAIRNMSRFSNGVYQIVKKIPRGKVLTYKQVALRLGNAKLARAVGNALNKNCDTNIPCHRVIRSDGSLGGYRDGIKKKALLLTKESYLKRRW